MQRVNFWLLFIVGISAATAKLDCQPRQIHLALGDAYYYVSQPKAMRVGQNHSATVVFHTNDHCDNPFLTIQNQGSSVVPVRVNNFTASYPDGAYKTYIFTFYIYDLVPETIYSYQIFVNDVSSQKYSFQLPRASKIDQRDQTTKFLFIGDIDMDSISGYTWERIRSRINSKNFTTYDAFIHLGDLAYNLEDDAGLRGDRFMENMSSIAAWMPYTVIPGNHEAHYNFSNFVNRIRMPLWEKTQNHYYSINIGLVHITTFNYDFFSANPSLQQSMLTWLENDLQRANQMRSQWPWLVLMNHKPLYCSDTVNYRDECRTYWSQYKAVDDLINKYKVDLYISGHVHSYERSLPVYQRKLMGYTKVASDNDYKYFIDPEAPIHVVEAIAGNIETHNLKPFSFMDFTIKGDQKMGYGQLFVYNATHLHYLHTRSETDQLQDEFYIIKSAISLFDNDEDYLTYKSGL